MSKNPPGFFNLPVNTSIPEATARRQSGFKPVSGFDEKLSSAELAALSSPDAEKSARSSRVLATAGTTHKPKDRKPVGASPNQETQAKQVAAFNAGVGVGVLKNPAAPPLIAARAAPAPKPAAQPFNRLVGNQVAWNAEIPPKGTTKPAAKPVATAPSVSFPKASDKINPAGLEKQVNERNRIATEGSASPQIFNINSFRSEILNEDVLPSHSYLVTFSPFRTGFSENAPLTDFVVNKRNTLVMRCESVILPTPSLLEEENIRRYGYGPVEKIPYGVQFSDVSMTWLVDRRSEIVDFMHQWLNTIVMHDAPNANMSQTTEFRAGLGEYSPFEVGYKDAYANPIVRIYVYDRTNATVTEYEMFDVFPMNIQSMNLSWADENQLQKLIVNFAYTNMRVKAPQKTTAAQANYMMEGQANPYEERKQPSDKGGRAAADTAGPPTGESINTTVNASNPNATESKQTAPTGVVVSPNSPQNRVLGP